MNDQLKSSPKPCRHVTSFCSLFFLHNMFLIWKLGASSSCYAARVLDPNPAPGGHVSKTIVLSDPAPGEDK
jgi:hypothetical protein